MLEEKESRFDTIDGRTELRELNELSNTTLNRLNRQGVFTISELLTFLDTNSINDIRGVGKVISEEIRSFAERCKNSEAHIENNNCYMLEEKENRLDNIDVRTELRELNELSDRTLNLLNRQGVFTISELLTFLDTNSIDDIRGVDKMISEEIRSFAERYKYLEAHKENNNCYMLEEKENRLDNIDVRTELRELNELSDRTLNLLNRQGVFTISELLTFLDTNSIDDIRGVGKTISEEIRSFAERYKNSEAHKENNNCYMLEEKENRFDNIDGRTELRKLNELSDRTLNLLNRQGVFTISELLTFLDTNSIDNIRWVGKVTSEEIRSFAERYEYLEAHKENINYYMLKEKENRLNNIDGRTELRKLNELSNRTLNLLNRQGVFTISELLTFLDTNSIDDIRGVGKTISEEIRSFVELYEYLGAHKENINYYMFEDIDKSNEDLPLDILSIVGVPLSVKEYFVKNFNIKTIGDFKVYSRKKIKSHVSQLNYNRIEELEKLLTKPIQEVLREILKEDEDKNKEFNIYLQRANGKTLQEIADNPIDSNKPVTRERIRQQEKKYYSKISPIVKNVALIMMDKKIYLSTDDISEIYYENGFDRIFIHTCKRIDEFEYFDFADTFVLKESGITEEKLVRIIEDYVNDGINLYEKIEDLEDILFSNGYEFIDLGRVINFANKYNYAMLGEFIFRKKPTCGLLCSNVVKTDFPKGIKLNNNDELHEQDLVILRKIVRKRYGDIELPIGDRALSTRISTYLVLSDRGMVIHPEHIHIDTTLIKDIKKFIDANDNNILYYLEIFAEFEGILKLTSNVDNSNFLHGVLQYYFPQSYDYSKDYLTKLGTNIENEASISDRINEMIIKMNRPVSKKELEKEFIGLTDTILLVSISNDERLIQWYYNYYSSMDIIRYNDQDIKILEELLKEVVAENGGYSSDLYFYNRVRSKYFSFIEKNHIESEMNLFYIVSNIFSEKFDFKRPHITIKNHFEVLTMKEIVLDILGTPEIYSYNKFKELSVNLMWSNATSGKLFKEIEQDYIRISQDKYVRKDRFTLKQENLNTIIKILEKRIFYDVLPIMSIDDYSEFPDISYDWNGFLLGSIVENMCHDFILIEPIIQDRRYQKGIITNKSSGLNSYSKIVANMMIAQNYKSLSESRMLSFLMVNNLTKSTIPKELLSSEFIKFIDDKYIVVE